MNKQLRDYYKRIDKALNCPRVLRKGFILDIQRMIEDFRNGHPGASFEEVRDFIGVPAELAATFIESLQSEIVERHIKRKRYIKRAAIAAFSVILVGLIVFVVYASSVRKDAVVTKESTIIIYVNMEE